MRRLSTSHGSNRRGSRRRGAAGFTLIELVLTILLLGIIASIVSQFVLQGVRSYSVEQDRGNVHSQARLAVERMAREIRAIRGCTASDLTLPAANPFPTLSFTDVIGTAVSFSVAGGNLTRGVDILAKGVTSAQPFRLLDKSGNPTISCTAPNEAWFVEIDLTCVEGGESLHLRCRIHPRNF